METTEYIDGGAGRIAGTLRVNPSEPKRVVILLHGILCHRDSMFFPLLAARLPFSSFRFDLRGHGDSAGVVKYCGYTEDTEDTVSVAAWLESRGYQVVGVIGHSRGGTGAMRYTALHGNLLFAVNLAGRFDMSRILNKHTEEERRHLSEHGWFDWKYLSRGQPASLRVTKEDFDGFSSLDMTITQNIPPSTAVLTVHGLNDAVVPVEDSSLFANTIQNHSLVLMRDTDHYFKGRHEEVVSVITTWLEAPQRRAALDRAFAVIPRSRLVTLEGVQNFRDLGGYPARGGCVTRPGVLFRSAELSELHENDHQVLHDLGVQWVLDLRSDRERGIRASPAIARVEHIACPIFGEEDYSPAALERRFSLYASGVPGFVEAYMYMMQTGMAAFGRALTLIADSPAGVVFHCTAGKDRTGILSMLLLSLFGVDKDVIAWDYEQTERLADRTPGTLARIAGLQGKLSDDQAVSLMSARAESMLLTMQAFEKKWGSVENYLTQAGVSKDTIQKLKDKLLVEPLKSNL